VNRKLYLKKIIKRLTHSFGDNIQMGCVRRLKPILITLTLPRQARLYLKPSRTLITNFKSRNTFHRHYTKPRNGFTTANNYKINPSKHVMSILNQVDIIIHIGGKDP
jgi:hypothetical protein